MISACVAARARRTVGGMWFDMEEVGLDFIERAPHVLESVAVANASPERVFEIFSTAEHDKVWFPYYQGGGWTSPEPRGVGTTRDVELSFLCTKERYLAWDRGRRIAMVFTSATVPIARAMLQDIRFEPIFGGKARITSRVYYATSPVVAPVHPAARIFFGRLFSDATRNLARFATENPR